MELLDGKSELKRLFAVWIRTVLSRQNKLQWAIEEIRTLRVLLTKRFGPLPLHVEAQIDSASAPEIEEWLQAFLSANSLNEIFRY